MGSEKAKKPKAVKPKKEEEGNSLAKKNPDQSAKAKKATKQSFKK